MTDRTRERLRIAFLVLVVAVTVAGTSLPTFAASNSGSIHVDDAVGGDGAVAGAPGETLTLTVWATGSSVSGYQARLKFDPDVVEVQSVSGSDAFAAPVATVDDETGWVDFNQIRTDGQDDPVLAEITVTLVGSSGDETTLTFEESETVLANDDGETMSMDEYGQVVVSVENDSTPTTTTTTTPTTTTSTPTTTTTSTPTTTTTTTTTTTATPTTTTTTTTTTSTPTTTTTTTTTTATPTTTTTTSTPTTSTPTTSTPTESPSDSGSNDDDGGGGGGGGGSFVASGDGGGSSGGGSANAAPDPEPKFVVRETNLSAEAFVPNETATVRVSVGNDGDGAGTYETALYVGGELVDTLTATLDPGETREFSVNYSVGAPGEYDVELGTDTVGSLQVTAATTTTTTAATTTTTTTETTATTDASTDPPSTSATTVIRTGSADTSGGNGVEAPGFGFAVAVLAIALTTWVAFGRRSK